MRVILFHADGLPLWALGAYGNDWIATPHLDAFAADAAVFDWHFADVPARLTFPPTARPLTGPDHLDAALTSLQSGTDKLVIVELPALLPPWPIEADDDADPAPIPDPPVGFIDPDDDALFERLQLTFAAVIEQWDESFAAYYERIAARGLQQQCLILLATGRGQHLGEHGMIGEARPWLHDEWVHLPLIARWPDGGHGRRVAHLTQTADLLTTVRAASGLTLTPDERGHDLAPLRCGAGPIRDYVVMAARDEPHEYALQTRTEKIIVSADPARPPMYFVKPDDRWEVSNMWTPHLDRAEALAGIAREYLEAAARPGLFVPPPLPQSEEKNGHSETGG